MIIIGERIDSSRKPMASAIERGDADFIKKEALSQKDAGADFIDINCGTLLDKEALTMKWLIGIVHSADALSLSIDSPNPDTIKSVLPLCKNGPLIINSITAEKKKADEILPFVKEYDGSVVALTMDEAGMPKTAADRVVMVEKILGFAKRHGVEEEKIYFDPLVQPVSSGQDQAKIILDSISMIKKLGNAKTICGLSNISYGLPNRSIINATFLAMCVAAGLDAVMIDPLDEQLMSVLSAALVLSGEDQYCMGYIQRHRRVKQKI